MSIGEGHDIWTVITKRTCHAMSLLSFFFIIIWYIIFTSNVLWKKEVEYYQLQPQVSNKTPNVLNNDNGGHYAS